MKQVPLTIWLSPENELWLKCTVCDEWQGRSKRDKANFTVMFERAVNHANSMHTRA